MKLEEEISQKNFRNVYHKAAVNVFYTFNWAYEFHTKILKPFNITPQQYNILRILRGQHPEPATVKLLKERMIDKMPDVSRIVEKLRTKGFVERHICEKDRRMVDVWITQHGLDLLARLDDKNDELDKFMSNLNIDEAITLNCLLDKLRG
ncbi:MAG: MarR family transcriptional regulator [Ignavibacteriales bacterium]|nr:MarR family transcriptional regulator [Ignavibacteriales bacterium]